MEKTIDIGEPLSKVERKELEKQKKKLQESIDEIQLYLDRLQNQELALQHYLKAGTKIK